MSEPLVQLQGISKSFPGTLANDRIDLALYPGNIHALLGENGAGKSTLVKILYGLQKPDAGRILWRSRPMRIDGPRAARALGIAMVFQHFSLFESLTVLENIALGLGVNADATLGDRIRSVSMEYGLDIDPEREVHTLSVGEHQRIEIVRCLLQSPSLLVMDEPTSVLTPQEANELFRTLRCLRDEGIAILYISHKLEEIRALCDKATILRQGRVVATADPRQESAASLAAMMMGQSVAVLATEPRAMQGELLLELRDVNARTAHQQLSAVSVGVHAGEIVGISGVAGNGQDLLLDVISGEHRVAADSIRLGAEAVGRRGPDARRRRGLGTVPEQRLGHAAVPNMTLAENVLLSDHDNVAAKRFGLLSMRHARHSAQQLIARYQVAAVGPDALATSLSGGNLQKFIVGREIERQPKVLVVAQPTWGVDAGAAAVIHRALQALARKGAGILLISQDVDELMQLSHRIGALCGGRLSAFYPTAQLDATEVGLLMGGQSELPAVEAAS